MAQAAWDAALLRTRIHRIDARLLNVGHADGGGTLQNETTVALSKSSVAKQWISTVALKIAGFPKEAPPDSDPAFYVEIIVKGVYTWNTPPTHKILSDPNMAHALGRQIYAVAVCECIAAAGKMGFHGLKVPADLSREDIVGGLPITSSDIEKLQLPPLRMKPAIKKAAPRKMQKKKLAS